MRRQASAIELTPIGRVESPLTDIAAAPKQGAIDGARPRVRNLEALDGTPIVDLKAVLSRDIDER